MNYNELTNFIKMLKAIGITTAKQLAKAKALYELNTNAIMLDFANDAFIHGVMFDNL